MNQANSNDVANARATIDAALSREDFAAARAGMAIFELQPLDPASANYIISRFEKMRGQVPLTPFRVAVLQSFTIEPLVPILRAVGLLAGLDLEIRVGDFNAYTQEILDRSSWLEGFEFDVVFLAVQACDLAPPLWDQFADLNETQIRQAADEVVQRLTQLIEAFRAGFSAPLVFHNLQIPPFPATGVLDAQLEHGQAATFAEINRQLVTVARKFRDVYVLDYDALVRRRGDDAFHDRAKWATVRMPIAAAEWIHLAREWLRFLCPLSGRTCKAVAVDLDNTLWGGVVGEDGIRLGEEYPGSAYRAVQRALLDLSRRGILLTICSKNNPAEALDVIDRHPGMLLRREHFAAIRINWSDKASNLLEIAAELNIGIDTIALFDDNPIERDWVRRQIPQVTVIELPSEPMDYALAVRQAPVFQRLQISADDRARGQYYAEQRERNELRQGVASIEDFYRSLQMSIDIQPATTATLPRAAQLTQKTNQFNLTTHRYTEQQLSEMIERSHAAYVLRATDRFGDNGWVGLAIVKFVGQTAEIDTFLLSCRVIGRMIESALLAALAKIAAARGMVKLTGLYVPTAKNGVACDFYPSHGFKSIDSQGDESRWEISLPASSLECPEWIDLHSSI